MRHGVANLLLLSMGGVLCGCSLIYNPSDIVTPVDAVDAEIIYDADPTQLSLSHVRPSILVEGQGVNGSRKAVLVVHGNQIVAGATVAITVHGTGAPHASITVDNAGAMVAANNKMIAVPVSIAVDTANVDDIRLDVTVTQPAGGGVVEQSLTEVAGAGALTLRGLDELDGGVAQTDISGEYLYSLVDVASITGMIGAAAHISIRSTSSIRVTGAASVSASGSMRGAGGNLGGMGATILGNATNGTGDGAGDAGDPGGGGGYATRGGPMMMGGAIAGSPSLPDLRTSRGSGGGGGTLLAAGGDGGASGGTLELSAAGDLTLGSISSRGGAGEDSAPAGGGGSGGAVLLRAGGAFTPGTVDVSGGAGAEMNPGGAGRIRFDSPLATATLANAYRGPMLALDTPLITTESMPQLTVLGQPSTNFSYFWDGFDSNGAAGRQGPFSANTGKGSNTIALPAPLYRGANTLCLLVDQGNIADQRPEAHNCIDIAHVFQQ